MALAEQSQTDPKSGQLASRGPLETTDRLALIGQLAAGLAHHMNTPLACVAAHAEECLELLDRSEQSLPKEVAEELRGRLLAIVRHTVRCAQYTQQLLQFARPPSRIVGYARIATALEDTRLLLKPVAESRGVRLEVKQPPANVVASISPPDVEQLLVNLVHNAIDACDQGGLVRINATVEGDYVRLVIEDNGCGIAPEHLPRVFEPFFTTKPEGSGSGLGLSVCHGIVRAVGGTIDITSRQGFGTKVTVRLPLAVHTV